MNFELDDSSRCSNFSDVPIFETECHRQWTGAHWMQMHVLCLPVGGMLLTTEASEVVTPARHPGMNFELDVLILPMFLFFKIECHQQRTGTHLVRMHALCLPLGGMLLTTEVVTPARRAVVTWHEF